MSHTSGKTKRKTKEVKHTKLTNREAYNLATLLAREATINKIMAGLGAELKTVRIQKEVIYKAYGLPLDQDFDFDEETNEVITHD